MSCRTVIFISGRGSNLKALLAHQRNFTVECVLSNREDAAGLAYATDHGIPTYVASRKDYPSVYAQKQALYRKVEELKPDFILLAGYMQIIEAEFITQYENRILNIHPSLLPAFPGLDPHLKAIEAGSSVHGCTVHLVTPEVDGGPLLAQMQCEVRQDDTEASLSQRVLELEHELYQWVVNAFASGDIAYTPVQGVTSTTSIRQEAEEKQIILAP